jgi:hypothetical protein
MKIKARYLISVVFLLCAAGCASGPTYEEYSSTIEPPLPLDGRIYIYRTTAFGAAVRPTVMVNSEEVGKANPKSFFYVDRLAGKYEVSASTKAEHSLSLTLEEGEVKYVRLDVKMGLFVGHVELVLVDKAVGEQELKSMNYTGEQAFVAR